MTRDEIIGALPNLDQADLKAIQVLITNLVRSPSPIIGRTGAIQNVADAASQLTLNALAATVGLSNATFSLPERTQGHFDKRCPKLINFLDENFTGWDTHKNSQIAFLRMLFGLLADDLKERGVNPTIGIMILSLGRIPEIVDAAYPGYRESGMTDLILRHFK